MSYTGDGILRPDNWPVVSGSGTWNRRQPQPPQQWSSAGAYATLTRPPPPAKPPRTVDSLVRVNLQPHFSRSQHQLNYAALPGVPLPPQQHQQLSSHQAGPSKYQEHDNYQQHTPSYSHVSRRFSEDDSASFYYIPANAHSSSVLPSPPSSSSSSFKPVSLKQKHDVRRKPIPPAKPPRTSLENNEPNKSRTNLIQSKSQRNLTYAWNKSIDFGQVPPPEGYGNIKRSASNDVEGFLTTFGGYTKGSFNRSIEHENAHQRLLTDGCATDHLYDEISSNGRQSVTGSNADLVTATNKNYSGSHHHPRSHPHHPVSQRDQQESQQVSMRASNKHLRSKSEHHPRCPNSSNHYETPMKLRDRSVERPAAVSDPNNWSAPVVSSSPPVARRVSSYDEYATVLHPPPADVALQTIRSAIKPIQQEYWKWKQESVGRSVGTRIEQHLFATIDAKGKKVSVKAKTLDRIPLLQDMAILTDPVSEDFFSQPENPFAVLCRSSKLSSDDSKRSLRRTKHHQFVHVGTAERKKKKLSLKSQDPNNYSSSKRRGSDGNPMPNNVQIGEPPPTIVIRPIEIDIVSVSPLQPSSSPFNDRKEWAEIESLMASFESSFKNKSPVPPVRRDQERGDDIQKEPTFPYEPDGADHKPQLITSILRRPQPNKESPELSPGLEGVKEFLFSIDLPDYTPLLVCNGFDDVRFMGSNVMEESDLREVGIRNSEHVSRIIVAARKRFPRLSLLDKNVADVTVESWLKSLNLEVYAEKFKENGFTDIEKIRKIWEVELNAVLDITKIGHRKRILVSLGERLSLMADLGLDDLDFDRISCVLSKSPEVMAKSPEVIEILEKRAASRASSSCASESRIAISSPRDFGGDLSETAKAAGNINSVDPEANAILSLTIASMPQWRHDPAELVDRRVDYTAFYLGSTLVKQLLGIESTRESIKKLKESTKDDEQTPTVILSIACTGVKFIDRQTLSMVCEHEIRNIHCACQDTDDFKHFAYITKDHESSNHYCHVFSALSLDLATEVILTLGQAFEVAYQTALGVDVISLSKTYQEAKKSQLLNSNLTTRKPKPIPPAKPASLSKFPASPAGTLTRSRKSEGF